VNITTIFVVQNQVKNSYKYKPQIQMKVKLLLLALFVSFFSSGQITENFDGTVTGWSFSGASSTTGQNCSGTRSILYTASGQFAITPAITNPNKLNCNIKRSSNTTAWSINVQISAASPTSQTSGPWTTVATIGSTVLQTCSAISEIDLSSYSGLRYIRFIDTRASGAVQRGIDDVSITVAPSGFSVSYNGNGSDGGTVPTDATSYASGANVTVLGNTGTLVRAGYTFAGWNTAANGSGTNYVAGDIFAITANTILYARWTPNSNTITFDKNAVDATGTTASQIIATAATANLTLNGFSWVGYTFAGWATTSTGAVAFADNASYTMGTANVTLYAVWNSLSPFITTSGTLAALSTTYGTASTNTTFTVSAGNLTNNLIITAPTGFEVSLTAGTGFATSIDLGTINRTNTTIYVRLAATTDFGTYSGNVVASSTGLTSVNVATAASNVNKKPLTITGLTGANKVYDGTTTATLTGTPSLTGVVFSDDVSVSGTPVSNFANKEVGNLKTITTTGYTLSGTKAANYSVSQPTGISANITPKALSVTAPIIASKVYNGSAVSGAVSVGTITGFVGTETVTATATGLYADANAAIGKTATVTYVLANGANGGLATNYSLATGTGIGDITKANPVFTVAAINTNVGGTQTISSTISNSNGVLSFTSNDTTIATVGATTGIVTGIAVGATTINVSQAESTNYFAGNTTVTVNVTTIAYNLGDFRTIVGTGLAWNTAANWQKYDGSNWGVAGADGVPPNGSTVYILGGISTASVGNLVMNNTIILSGGVLTLAGTAYSSTTKMLVKTGGILQINTRLTNNGAFEVEDNATVNFNISSFSGNELSTTLWNGAENFHPTSNFVIQNHGSGGSDYFIPSNVDITANSYNGFTACFGNLIFDSTASPTFPFFGTSAVFNKNLTHTDFILRSNATTSNAFRFLGTNTVTSSLTAAIGRNIVMESGFNRPLTLTSTGTTTINLTVNGSLFNYSTKALNLTSNANGTVTVNVEGDIVVANTGSLNLASNGTAIVNLKGDLTVESSALLTSGISSTFNFSGAGNGSTDALTQTIDVANTATALNINFNVNSGAYTKLIDQDFALGTNSAFTVRTGGTFDFGFIGLTTTALNLVGVTSQIGQTFTAQSGATLKITSPFGITTAAASATAGNVQTPVAGRTYNATSIYHYIGKANQVSGNGLPNTAANKHVIVELDTDNLEFTSTNGIIRFNNPTTAIGSNFKGLEIRKGTVIADDAGNRFEDSATSGESGNLKMTGGIYKIFSRDIQPAVSGNYDLSTGSKIVFAHTTAAATTQAIRGGTNYQYPEIEVEGKDVRYSNIGVNMKSNGLFTVKENAVITNTGIVGQIVSLDDLNPATVIVKNTGIFKTEKEKGFNGVPDDINPSPSVRTNHTSGNVIVVLEAGSTVDYSRAGDQTVTLFSPSYRNLTISGTGVKTLQNDTATRVEEDLKVDAAKLLLTINQILTVKEGVFIAATGAEFELDNNAQLIQIDEADTNTGTNFKLKRLAFVHAQDYVYWSSPVFDFNVGLIPTQQRYFWNPLYVNTNGTLGNWNSAVGAEATMAVGKGFIVNSGSGYPIRPLPATSLETNFVGRPNNGTLTSTIQRGTNAASIDDNWNLVGNPYPSAIFAEEFLDANVDKINGSVWVWTHGQAPDNAIDPYYDNFGANYYATDYLKYNKLGATDTTFNGIIASGQGFMVNMLHTTPSTSETVTFTNAMRTDGTATPYNNSGFYKTANTNLTVINPEEKHRIWLTIINTAVGQKEAALLGYSANSTLAVDHFYDCVYVPRTEVGIYTLVNTGEYVIQGRPVPFVDSDLVPLGVKIVNAGSHKIAIKKVDGLFEGNQGIYLEDTLLGIVHDLKAAPYTFTSEVGVFNSRFIVRYTSSALSNNDFDSLENGVIVSSQNTDISVKSNTKLITSVAVYDILGRELVKKSGVDSNEFTFVNVSNVNQALIVKVTLENGQVVTRKIVL
jgi:uncharacterized repeat protein (TIGR02543 family)